MGPTGIFASHRARAASIERYSGAGKKRILELGAGAGGTAAAMADLGHSVIAIELSPLRASFARELAQEARQGQLTIIEGDYYALNFPEPFDLICHWDSFGMGTDADNRRLLRRMAEDWLAPKGCVLMDVFNPWWWIRRAGTEERDEERDLMRGYDFDPIGGRLLDHWWPIGDKSQLITQTARCYTPADFLLLIEGTGLTVELFAIDGNIFRAGESSTIAHPLGDALSYFVKLVLAG
ncbi:SAM-dependent methyltransferase [Ktedonosporobacter rubrisoli]|nr:class I SAM-dependent methyltransferase [Ktedonosporobacter rubrisoli]